MKKCFVLTLAIAVMFITQAGAVDKLESIAMTMADYLTAGRIVVAKNQMLINDPAIGNKGFTSQSYERQVRSQFMEMSGIDIKRLIPTDDFNKALFAIHESSKEVIDEAQPQINEPGKAFKEFIPAVFGRRVGDKLLIKTGIIVKQTSRKFRGDYNKPDDFEVKALNKLEAAGRGNTYFEETKFGDTRVLRYLVPLYIERSCLLCHGEPAGEKDITGRIKEGYKEGDMRGAISVIVPIKCELDSK
jgi:general secretion pathway protein A